MSPSLIFCQKLYHCIVSFQFSFIETFSGIMICKTFKANFLICFLVIKVLFQQRGSLLQIFVCPICQFIDHLDKFITSDNPFAILRENCHTDIMNIYRM